MNIYIDATNVPVGRLGSFVAKMSLKGHNIKIINSEYAIISGNKKDILDKIIKWRKKGGSSLKGPKVSKQPEKLLKRMIRGMLPRDRKKGKEAYKRIKCYLSNQISIEKINKDELVNLKTNLPLKYLQLKEICKLI